MRVKMGDANMREIEWYETYEIGFPALDRDHRRLFDIANGIIRALGEGDYGGCKPLAAGFVDALKQHFPREEKFLEEIGYPGRDKHAGYHRQLLQRAEKFLERLEGRAEDETLAEPLAELVSVLIADLRGGDLNFRSFLLEEGTKKAMMGKRYTWL